MEIKISQVEVQKKNKDRVNLYVDGEFFAACSTLLVYRYNIAKDKNFSLDELKEIIQEDNALKCKDAALKLVEKSWKTEKEMEDKLIAKGYDSISISTAVKFLKEYKYLNDDHYAEMYIKERMAGEGQNKVSFALLKKGISKDIVEKKIQMLMLESEHERGLKLAKEKLENVKKEGVSRGKLQKTLSDYLYRLGFEFNVIKEIIDNIFSSYEEDESCDELKKLAQKRLNVLLKSESDKRKVSQKLTEYLLRRGYAYGPIKKAVKEIMDFEVEQDEI